MRILVPLKSIQDPSGLIVNRKAGKVFVNKEEYVMNPASKRALEAALRIKDKGEADVIALAFGSPDSHSVNCLREARAMGASCAILISAPVSDSATVVTLTTALMTQLSNIDLVILGNRSLDTGLSSGARLAEALGWPFLGEAVEVKIEENVVRIVCRGPAHPYEAQEADLPAIVAVTRDGPAPRYAHGGAIITSYRAADSVETLALTDLGLSESDLAAATAERGQSFPPEREFGKQVSIEDTAALLGRG